MGDCTHSGSGSPMIITILLLLLMIIMTIIMIIVILIARCSQGIPALPRRGQGDPRQLRLRSGGRVPINIQLIIVIQ